jgi:hypothetical protein
MRQIIATLFLLAQTLPATMAAEPGPSDAAMSALLPGTWINPPDSPDYEQIPSREVFLADGSYTYFEYKDKACKRQSEAIKAKWTIRDGILTSFLADGSVIKDKIISVSAEKIVLRSLDDGKSYFRIKSLACPTAPRPRK